MANPPRDSSSTAGGLPDSARELMRHAIDDLQGSIRANDAKASAALVVHGLLFAGVLTITREIDSVYRDTGCPGRAAIVALLVLALAGFVLSVVFLLRAVSPYRPKDLANQIAGEHPRVFFPDFPTLTQDGGAGGELEALRRRTDALKDTGQLDAEYRAELLKLSAILDHEAAAARLGYLFLRAEVICVGFYLLLVGILAVTQ